jgi:SAM-dependent methyltransferase
VNLHSPVTSAKQGTAQSDACRLCGAQLRHTLVDLGMSPLCESILAADQLDQMEVYFPLHVLICHKCHLVQLKQYASPEEIFRDYAYFSSYSTTWVAHAKAYCEAIASRLALDSTCLVIELASNDGYLLQHFRPLGIPVLGIEPALNVAKVAIANGVPTRTEFFGVRLADELVAEGKSADLIVANNVLAQVPDLNDFVAGIARLLKPEGVATLEFPHLRRLMEGNQFDTIYHEHFSYFSLLTIRHLAQRHELRLIDVEELPTHGGSLRVHLVRTDSRRPSELSVVRLLEREAALGYGGLPAYAEFARQVQDTKRKLLSCLIDIKKTDQSICGYGAPGKGNTLLNYCGIGRDFLDFTVDRNPHKHGRFTPGMHIPILPVEYIDLARPAYVLILPWNLRHEIIQQMRHISSWGGKFIVAIPEAEIVDPAELVA